MNKIKQVMPPIASTNSPPTNAELQVYVNELSAKLDALTVNLTNLTQQVTIQMQTLVTELATQKQTFNSETALQKQAIQFSTTTQAKDVAAISTRISAVELDISEVTQRVEFQTRRIAENSQNIINTQQSLTNPTSFVDLQYAWNFAEYFKDIDPTFRAKMLDFCKQIAWDHISKISITNSVPTPPTKQPY